MQQKIKDILLLLQKDRKAQTIAGVVMVFVILAFVLPDAPGAPPPRRRADQTNMSMAGKEMGDDLMQAMKTDQDAIKGALTDLTGKVDSIKQKQGEFEENTATIFKRMLGRIAEMENKSLGAAQVGGAPVVEDPNSAAPGVRKASLPTENFNVPPPEPQPFGEAEPVQPVLPPRAEPKKLAVVGAGDSVRVKLIAGVDAPTDGTPYPVVFKLLGDVLGPDGSTLPLGEARLIAAAQGSLVDSRALFRLTTMNVRLPDGRRRVFPVDGWIVGEDGIRGMEGILIDPIGKAIAGAGMAGALGATGAAVANNETTTTFDNNGNAYTYVTGDEAKYIGGSAMSGASKEWMKVVESRIKLLVPHVQVLSGREATAVFSKSFSVADLFDQLDEDTQSFSTHVD